MFKSTLFKIATPIACALSVAFTSLNVSAAPYYYGNYYGNGYCQTDCSDPYQDPCCRRGWWRDAAIFIGSAAIGAIAGVAAANANRHRGKRGAIGPQGPQGIQGIQGVPGTPGAGFSPAVVPVGQPDAGAAITQLTFTFTTVTAISAAANNQAYVTTPDGRTFLGTILPGTVGSTAFVTIPSGPFFQGTYDVGFIMPTGVISLDGLVRVEITNINGAPASPALHNAGVVAGPSGVVSTQPRFFNAEYPFQEVP